MHRIDFLAALGLSGLARLLGMGSGQGGDLSGLSQPLRGESIPGILDETYTHRNRPYILLPPGTEHPWEGGLIGGRMEKAIQVERVLVDGEDWIDRGILLANPDFPALTVDLSRGVQGFSDYVVMDFCPALEEITLRVPFEIHWRDGSILYSARDKGGRMVSRNPITPIQFAGDS